MENEKRMNDEKIEIRNYDIFIGENEDDVEAACECIEVVYPDGTKKYIPGSIWCLIEGIIKWECLDDQEPLESIIEYVKENIEDFS